MIKKMLYSFLVFVMALILIVYLCLTTTVGNQILFNIAKISLPGKITLQQLQGNLHSGLHLKQLSYKTKTLSLSLDELHGSIKITALLNKTIAIKNLTIKQLHISQAKTMRKSDKKKAASTFLPFHLLIQQTQLIDSLYQYGKQRWSLQQLNIDSTLPLKDDVILTELKWQNLNLQTTDLTPLTSKYGQAAIKTQGKLHKKNIKMQLQQLSGQWQDQVFSGHGSIAINNNTWNLQDIIIKAGNAYLSLSGNIGKKWQLAWDANIPNLANFLPKTKGQIKSQGSLTGKRASPQISTSLSVNNLALKHIQIAKLTMEVQPNQITSITGNNIMLAQWQLDNLHINIKQHNKQHTAQLSVQTPTSNLEVLLSGTEQPQQWPIWLKKFTFSSKEYGTWKLNKTARFLASKHDIKLNRFCLKNNNQASICAQAYWKPEEKWRTHIQAHAVPLESLPIKKQQDIQLDGNVSLDIKLSQILDQLTGHFAISLSQGNIRSAFIEEESRLNWQSGNWQGKVDKEGLSSHFNLTITDDSAISGTLNLPKLSSLATDINKQAIQSHIQANITQLAFIHLIFPDIQKAKGHLSANWQMTGTVGLPEIKGDAKLTQASCHLPKAGITLDNIDVNISSPTFKQVNYVGSMRANQGTLNIQGNTSLSTAGFTTKLHLTGKNALILDNTIAKLTIDPDLQLTMKNNHIDLTGDIHLPMAIITPKDFSNGVTLSDDVVFASDIDEARPKTHFSSQVTLTLGEHVFLNYLGLSAHLGGHISLYESSSKITTAIGELYVANGFYNAYNQKLNISQGQLMFTGGPVTNPGVNIKASKEVNTLAQSSASNANYTSNRAIVGISITGTLKKPQLDFFSDPPGLSQSQILSNLALGASLDDSKGREKELTKALSSSNISKSQAAMLKEQLQYSLGLDELNVTSGDVYDANKNSMVQNTSLTLGKMLSPRLYMSYSIGLIESINIFNVNYKINDEWKLRSQTDLNASAVDLIYSFDKN